MYEILPIMLHRYTLMIFLALTGLLLWACGDKTPVPNEQVDPHMDQVLGRAAQLIEHNFNDSALTFLEPLLGQLEAQGLIDSPFGLKAQLAKGKAYEQDNQNKKAMFLLNDLRDKCETLEQWDIYAKSCLALAQLHQKIFRKNEMQQQLSLARTAITEHQLDSLYPELVLRLAFWHQNFGYPDSVVHYSEQVFAFVEKEGNPPRFTADYYTLMGIHSREKDFRQTIRYFQSAVTIAKDMKDYSSLSSIWNETARTYIHYDQLQKSFLFNDSTIWASYQAIAVGHENIYTLGAAYKRKAKLYGMMGQLDSSVLYTSRGFAQELAFIEKQERDRIVEIDERYENEKKSYQLAQQAQTIRQERLIRYLILSLALAILGFAAVLGYYYAQLRRSNQKTQEQAKMLKTLDVAKSRFFANVSHELRTPLTLLLGPIKSLLKEKQLSTHQQDLLQLAHQSVQQLEHLINEILDLQKLEKGKLELRLQSTELNPFFRPFIAQFESLAAYRAIHFLPHIDIQQQVIANIDREKYRQIIYNLLSNAFKFTPQGGKVEAKIAIEQGQLVLQVADSGPGIPPEDLPHVFDRYFQTKRPDRPAEGGTGIGLALCSEYAKLMKGDIHVESQLGAGTAFTVSIPIEASVKGDEKQQALPESKEPLVVATHALPFQPPLTRGGKTEKPHILLVEDNVDLQAYLSLVLSPTYKITPAQNGQEALDLLAASNAYDLILSDLMMPVMDGHQLLKRLKTSDATRHIPVIMLTARADVQDKLKALRIGVDDYLPKPFNEEELKMRIKNLLHNQGIRKQQSAEAKEVQPHTALISETDQVWLSSFEQFVRENIGSELLSVSLLADEFAMSESTLLRQLKRLTGLTPRKYLQEARLDEARRLLENGSYSSVAQVASAIGYGDARSLTRRFKERYGKLPSEV